MLALNTSRPRFLLGNDYGMEELQKTNSRTNIIYSQENILFNDIIFLCVIKFVSFASFAARFET